MAEALSREYAEGTWEPECRRRRRRTGNPWRSSCTRPVPTPPKCRQAPVYCSQKRVVANQLAEARKSYGLAQREVATRMHVSIARVSRIEHGEVAALDVLARYVEALGGRLDLVADFGDHTVRMPGSGGPKGVAAQVVEQAGQSFTLRAVRFP
ncbi:helix-turn-helix domain-containing protein [Streptomyces sp. CA-294286]|uniref:helix-turn-helix domain-containing protein n=1 Tax=Streptomyces sp. CA-294286 TaxID=3240070 RepID=UPI003D9375AA